MSPQLSNPVNWGEHDLKSYLSAPEIFATYQLQFDSYDGTMF